MSTAARKIRRRADIGFERTPKVGTPILERTIGMNKLVREVKARGLEDELSALIEARKEES